MRLFTSASRDYRSMVKAGIRYIKISIGLSLLLNGTLAKADPLPWERDAINWSFQVLALAEQQGLTLDDYVLSQSLDTALTGKSHLSFKSVEQEQSFLWFEVLPAIRKGMGEADSLTGQRFWIDLSMQLRRRGHDGHLELRAVGNGSEAELRYTGREKNWWLGPGLVAEHLPEEIRPICNQSQFCAGLKLPENSMLPTLELMYEEALQKAHAGQRDAVRIEGLFQVTGIRNSDRLHSWLGYDVLLDLKSVRISGVVDEQQLVWTSRQGLPGAGEAVLAGR